MADTKLTALTEDTAPTADDLIYTVTDPAGTPASRKATIANLTKAMLAAQSDQETATSTTLFVTPARQQFHPSAAKCWVVWGVTTTIDASYNITSITDNGTGDWTITIATDFSSVNYVAVATPYGANFVDAANGQFWSTFTSNTAKAAGVIRMQTYYMITTSFVPTGTSLGDPTKNHVAMFGDQ